MAVELFIGPLPFDASSQTVSEFLWDWIVPESTHVQVDRDTGRSKGFGFVVVANPEDAVVACRASDADAEMNGRRLVICVARRRVRARGSTASRVQVDLEIADSAHGVTISFSDLQQELLRSLRMDTSTRDFWVTNSLLRLHPNNEQWRHEPMRRQVALLVEAVAENPALLVEVHPQLFEHLIAALLTASGYHEVRLTVPSADGGVDIFATKNSALGKALYVIQCKRYAPARKVSRPQVQLTYGVLAASSATSAAIVTTSSFTKPAREFLKEQQYKISGLDGRDLEIWLQATAQMLDTPEPIGSACSRNVAPHTTPTVPGRRDHGPE